MPDQPRPWMTDAEIERSQTGGGFAGGGYGSVMMRPVKPPRPEATHGLLITFVAVFVLEWIVLTWKGVAVFQDVFTIHSIPGPFDWARRPWSPITATLSHSPTNLGHIFFNGLALFFFGPMIENILGRTRFLAFFLITGAVSSIAQAILEPGYALGASGALMAMIGVAIVVAPKLKLIIFPLPIPIPLWIGGIIFALLDLIGAFSGSSGIGNVAHLSGLAIGLLYGFVVRNELRRKGLRIMTG